MGLEILLIYLGAGCVAGLLAGLLGVGGGIVIVPVLVFAYSLLEVNTEVAMHLAIGTSLASIVVTSVSSIRAHQQRGAILWSVMRALTPGVLVGALLGSWVADALRADVLRSVFGVFAVLVAIQMMVAKKSSGRHAIPASRGLLAVGTVIGFLSSLVGIGGGSLTVPFLNWCSVTIRNAVATSAAVGLPIAIAGSAGFIFNGWDAVALPPWSTGYVYWPALLGIVVASSLLAPVGARLAHTLPTAALQRGFAVFLAVVGIRMLLG